MENYSLYINGGFVETKTKQRVINPSTGETLAEVCIAGKNEADLALESAREAFDNGEWPKLPLSRRKDFLLKISQGILEKCAELAKLETENTGKPVKETTFMDLPSSAKTFEFFANNLQTFLADLSINLENARAHLAREPQGLTLLIIPWNYPLLIASWKIAQALAAGNCVILKPSSLTPLSAMELANIIHNAGLPKGVFNVINGPGEKLGQMLCPDRRVDMISFTGSNEAGKQILSYSSKSVKKLIMELGGKSAGIILKDTDIETAVNGSLCSIFLNQGQMCTAMARIFVHEDIYDKFARDFVQKAQKIKLGSGLDYETQMGPLISEGQRKKVLDFVQKAQTQGAKLLCGGKIPQAEDLKNGFFFEPAVFENVSADMDIFQKEVFGPVVCLIRFSEEDEVIELANNTNFALAASIWSKDLDAARNLAKRINAGTVWINTYGMFYNELPYGGFKQSGFGKELGREGFLEYTRLKNIIQDTTDSGKPLVSYWYGF